EGVVGAVGSGVDAWRAAGVPVSTSAIRRVAEEVRGTPLDVRQADEWATGHIPAARHLELGSVIASTDAIPCGPLAIYCGHGERAMTAASLLEGQGRASLAVLDGGFEAWRSARRPIAGG